MILRTTQHPLSCSTLEIQTYNMLHVTLQAENALLSFDLSMKCAFDHLPYMLDQLHDNMCT